MLQSQRNVPAPTGYIQGVVQGEKGPEAGVWVIAETKDLPTNFIKIVVTDDQGRFMVPELPAANYSVWVRGYGLVDSTPIKMKPGADADHADGDARRRLRRRRRRSIPATTGCRCSSRPRRANFPAPAPQGNGIGTDHADPEPLDQLAQVRLQLLPSARQPADAQRRPRLKAKPELKTHAEAWEWRLGTGVRGTSMYGVLTQSGQGPAR